MGGSPASMFRCWVSKKPPRRESQSCMSGSGHRVKLLLGMAIAA